MNQLINNKSFIFIVTGLLTALTSYAIINVSDLYLALLITLVTAFLIIVTNHRIIFYLIFFSSFFLDNLFYVFNVPAKYLISIDLLIFLLFLYSVSTMVIGSPTVKKEDKKALELIAGMMILLCFSFMQGKTQLTLSIRASMYHIRYILFFISLLILEKDLRFYKKVFNLIVIIGFLQIPISMIQKIVYPRMATDFMGGTVSLAGYSTNYGSVFCVMIFSFFVVKYIVTQRQINIFFMLLFIIPTVFSSARAILFAYVLNYILAQFILKKKNLDVIKKTIQTTLIVLILIVILYVSLTVVLPFFDARDNIALKLFTNWTAFQKYTYGTTDVGQLNRLQIMVYLFEIFEKNLFNLIFGFGPGSHTTSNVLSQIGSSIQVKGLKVAGAHSFGYTILELGVLYLFSLTYFLSSACSKALKSYNKTKGNYWKTFCGTYFLVAITFLYSSLYHKVWLAHGISFTMWFMTAALIKYINQKDTLT